MIVQEADVAGDGNTEFVVSPKHGISGRISVIDLQTDRVLWTSRQSVCGGMTVNVVGSNSPGRNRAEDIRISSIVHPHVWKILDGQTGRVVEVAKPSPGHHHGDSARLARSISRRPARRGLRLPDEHQAKAGRVLMDRPKPHRSSESH